WIRRCRISRYILRYILMIVRRREGDARKRPSGWPQATAGAGLMVRTPGIEPGRGCPREILSLLRLPVPPRPLRLCFVPALPLPVNRAVQPVRRMLCKFESAGSQWRTAGASSRRESFEFFMLSRGFGAFAPGEGRASPLKREGTGEEFPGTRALLSFYKLFGIPSNVLCA